VAYHEAYWVVIANATPVIALANTVAITDVVNVWFSSKPLLRSKRSEAYYLIIISLSVPNFIAQTILLSICLHSLLYKEDAPSAWFLIVLLLLGFMYILITVLFSVRLRYTLRRDEARENESAKTKKPKSETGQADEVSSGLGWPPLPPSS
jgi:F0F1-type ATP synthase assembly protein I